MTEEQHKLLVQDIFSRFPYGIVCDITMDGTTITEKLGEGGLFQFKNGRMEIVPYLRPLLSMTDSEYEEMNKVLDGGDDAHIFLKHPGWLELWLDSIETDSTIWMHDIFGVVDWLNEHHFDFRGLIEQGLAKPAPEDMYIVYINP